MQLFDNIYIIGDKLVDWDVEVYKPNDIEELSKEYRLNLSDKNRFLTHISLWRMLEESDMNKILVIDNAKTMHSQRRIEYLINKLYLTTTDFDMLFLGKTQDDCSMYKYVADNVYETTSPSLYAYIITRECASKLLTVKFSDVDIDRFHIVNKDKLKLKFLTFHPNLFYRNQILNNECKEESQSYIIISVIIMIILLILFVVIKIYFFKRDIK